MKTIPVICGPTGVGKTEIAINLAESKTYEIVSADSRQIYRYMDIGTAKPTPDQQKRVRIHMIDIVTPDTIYSAAEYAREATTIIEKTKKKLMVVGGSGLYIRALFEPFFESSKKDAHLREKFVREPLDSLYDRLSRIDPEAAERIHPHDRQRIIRALEVYEVTSIRFSDHLRKRTNKPLFRPLYIGLILPRKILYRVIDQRFDSMVKKGFIDEVKRLKKNGYSSSLYAFNALGYREIFEYLEGRLTKNEAFQLAKRKTHNYARRQLTWFQRIPEITWFENTTDVLYKISEILP